MDGERATGGASAGLVASAAASLNSAFDLRGGGRVVVGAFGNRCRGRCRRRCGLGCGGRRRDGLLGLGREQTIDLVRSGRVAHLHIFDRGRCRRRRGRFRGTVGLSRPPLPTAGDRSHRRLIAKGDRPRCSLARWALRLDRAGQQRPGPSELLSSGRSSRCHSSRAHTPSALIGRIYDHHNIKPTPRNEMLPTPRPRR